MKNLIVREAVISDAVKIYNLIMKTSDETNFLSCSSEERKGGFTIEGQEAHIKKTINSNNKIYICESEGELIGELGMKSFSKKRLKHRATFGITVLKKFWGIGVGNLLMKNAVDFFYLNEELTKLELEVRSDNVQAINLYKKFGFKTEAEVSNYFFINGKYYSVLIMALIK